MTTALILLLPNFQEQFIIETNTLEFDIGIILMQQGHPIAYISKSLTHKWRSYLVFHTFGFDIGIILMQQGHPIAYIGKSLTHKWRSYLAGTHFVIKDDNFCLTYILEQNIFTP